MEKTLVIFQRIQSILLLPIFPSQMSCYCNCCHHQNLSLSIKSWIWSLLEMLNVMTSKNLVTPTPMRDVLRHIKNFWKVPNFWAKKRTFKHVFSFFCWYACLAPKIPKMQWKMKMPNYFCLRVIVWYPLIVRILQKLMLQQIIMSSEFYNIVGLCHFQLRRWLTINSRPLWN